MDTKKNILVLKKQLQTENIFKTRKNNKLFKIFDEQIIQKCFSNLSEQSNDENILSLDAQNLNSKDITLIVDNFINIKISKKICKKRNIFEIIKVSNLPSSKLEKALSKEQYQLLGQKLLEVSCETNLISFDFMVIRILNNLILKTKDTFIRKEFSLLKKITLDKMKKNTYQKEIKDKISTVLCWVDCLLNLTLTEEITLKDFIKLNIKIVSLTYENIDLLWKISSATSFLLNQQNFCDAHILRSFKRYLNKNITNLYAKQTLNKNNITDILVSTLAKQTICKEDYYYLFDGIKLLSKQSSTDKLFCYNLLWYLLYQDKKTDIFYFRFIREYFLKTLFETIEPEDDLCTKIEEYVFLNMLLIEKDFFKLNQNEILKKIIILLQSFNDDKTKITPQQFYKFCDMLDYLIEIESPIEISSLLDTLATNKRPLSVISKHFQLYNFKYSV